MPAHAKALASIRLWWPKPATISSADATGVGSARSFRAESGPRALIWCSERRS